MMNIKKILTFACCLFIATAMSAQFGQSNQGPKPFSPEAYNQSLENFVRDKADLTQQECQKFFPMMHEMLNKQRDVTGKIHMVMFKGSSAKTEADYEQCITQITDLEVQSKKIEQVYYKKFHNVLSWEKILKVRNALYRFSMEALQKFTPQRGQQSAPNWMQRMPSAQQRFTPNAQQREQWEKMMRQHQQQYKGK